MIRIAIIIGSTRPARNGAAVGRWVYQHARKRRDARFELVDLLGVDLPFLDEPVPPSQGVYSQPHTRAWAARVDSFDAFVLVTPEYNHSVPAALKNALDFVYREWNNKAAAFVSYGGAGGTRAVEQLRLIMAELQVATVRAQVTLSLHTDFKDFKLFKPAAGKEKSLKAMLDQLIPWAAAMQSLRRKKRRTGRAA